MREIKFRAWDSDLKYMFSCETKNHALLITFDGIIFDAGHKFTSQINQSENIYLMQFTGLKDKNGKDIYEGDIIKNQSGRTARVNWHLFSGSWDAEPVYCGGDPEGLQTNLWRRYAEVIGNIHENPELME